MTSPDPDKDLLPRPVTDEDNAAYWAACRDHELRIQRCDDCAAWRFPPRPRCPQCHGTKATWARCSGRGVVHTFTVCHPPVLPAFAQSTPYAVVAVALDEGPIVISNLVDGEPEVGLAVEVTFTDIDDDFALPLFRTCQNHRSP
jgi:uncharacterized OB-fold protein